MTFIFPTQRVCLTNSFFLGGLLSDPRDNLRFIVWIRKYWALWKMLRTDAMSECLSIKLPVHWYLALMERGWNETPCWSNLVSLLFSSSVSVGISGIGGWAHPDHVWHVQWWPLTDHRCVHWAWSPSYPDSQMQNSWGGLGGDLIRD